MLGSTFGRDLTADGSVLLGGTGEEVSSHWLEIVPARTHAEDATISVGVDERANYPGEFIEIPQVRRTAKYITMDYTDYEGFPPPLTNGGLNEHGVAARDIWAPSRPELAAMTPEPQHGPNYSDLSRIAMERATSAREAVAIIGSLMDEYGYSTYGGNSHLFADAKEGWVVLNFAGGQGLWIAKRLGPDEVRMSYPGYIHEVPTDFRQRDDGSMGRRNFIDVRRGAGLVGSAVRRAVRRQRGLRRRRGSLRGRAHHRGPAAPAGGGGRRHPAADDGRGARSAC
ncbi:MAG: C69 family dipeptidase [Gammaproteobacteria bacterium]|nr:C69 family dipeptidase [Gammaproteobacteria bacterium]